VIRRTVLLLALLGAAVLTAVLAPTATAAPTPAVPKAALTQPQQDTFDHTLQVSGWAYDPARPGSSITVSLSVDGHHLTTRRAASASSGFDRDRHITGAHRFSVTLPRTALARTVTVTTRGASPGAPVRTVARRGVTHVQPPAGTRVVTVAKRYVGHARYVEGGASPRAGFDCSGYTRYAYATAHVGALPHSSEGQRRLKRLHVVSKAKARPGDLVFYLSGGTAYHVAIYAGHGMQYAAATVRDGIRYQAVWSSAVQYRHYS
jgi:cell wall-associated NlpC family hydrolase